MKNTNVLTKHRIRARALRDIMPAIEPEHLEDDPLESHPTPRDAPFLFAQALEADELASHGLRLPKSGPGLTATCRLFTEALIASANGRAMAYSRRKAHYDATMRRYMGP